MTVRLWLAVALLVATIGAARGEAAASDPSVVSHQCVGTDTSVSGLRAFVCVDGHIYDNGSRPIFGIVVEYVCVARSVIVRCSGVNAYAREYVSPYGWVGATDHWTCGTYSPLHIGCGSGRNYDNFIDMIAVPFGGSHHWIGRTWSVTFNNQGTLFYVNSYTGLDFTARLGASTVVYR